METAVLVPIKSFQDAKGRLAGAFTPAVRADLARRMAEIVLRAARPYPVFVACDDERVAEWSESRDADALWTPGLGLNGAIEQSVDMIAGKGFDQVVIAHSDLPLATTFSHIDTSGTVTLVPDHRLDGTNVQSRPTSPFEACYGPGSFRRHLAAALADGLPVRVVVDADLCLDVDTIDDLCDPRALAMFTDLLAPTDTVDS